MEKCCANHPESMALATCKACGKSVCLMCVVDEKEGTFCSTNCHAAHVAGEAVPAYVDAPAQAEGASGSGSASEKLESIFDSEPSPPAEGGYPPSSEPEPIVAEGTKWRPIGAQCEIHTDTPAVANCDRCGKPVCALCLLEASAGTFCSSECMDQTQGAAPQEAAAIAEKPIPPVPKRQVQAQAQLPRRRKKGGAGKLLVSVLVILLLLGGGLFAWKTVDPQGCAAFLRQVPALEPVAQWAEGEKPPTPPTPPVKPPVVVVKPPDPIKPPDPVKPPVKPPDPVVKPPDPVKPPVKPPDPVVKPPDPVKPPVKPPPKPEAPKPTRLINPWSEQSAGAWYRIRTESGGQVTYTDYGLKEKGSNFYVLNVQTSTKGQAGAAQESRTQVEPVVLHGEQTLSIDSRSFACEIRATGPARKVWALLQGRNAGAVLKEEQADGLLTAQRVWDHPLRINGQLFECLVVEAQFVKGESRQLVKTWYSSEVPLGLLKQEKPGSSVSLVDFGTDWSKRPPFPTN